MNGGDLYELAKILGHANKQASLLKSSPLIEPRWLSFFAVSLLKS